MNQLPGMLFPLGFDAKLEYEQSESKEETMRNKKG